MDNRIAYRRVYFCTTDNRKLVAIINRRKNTIRFDGGVDKAFDRWLRYNTANISCVVTSAYGGLHIRIANDREYESFLDRFQAYLTTFDISNLDPK